MDSGFKVLHRLLQAASARQKVIASNVANADTPGYKARDVKFGDMLGNEMKLKSTNPKHVTNDDSGVGHNNIIVQRNPSWGDRNNVELNVEVAKMTENSLMHNTALKLLNVKIKMYRAAIKAR